MHAPCRLVVGNSLGGREYRREVPTVKKSSVVLQITRIRFRFSVRFRFRFRFSVRFSVRFSFRFSVRFSVRFSCRFSVRFSVRISVTRGMGKKVR